MAFQKPYRTVQSVASIRFFRNKCEINENENHNTIPIPEQNFEFAVAPNIYTCYNLFPVVSKIKHSIK